MKTNSKNKHSSISNIKFNKYVALKWDRFHWSAFLLCSVIASRPVIIFLNSNTEFSISFAEVAKFCCSIFFYTFLILFIVGTLLKSIKLLKIRRYLTSVLLGLSILLWLQGNFFLWNYGELDGKPLNFEAYTIHGLFEAMIWLAIMVFVVAKFEIVSAWIKKIVFVILFSLLCNTAFAYIDKPKNVWHKLYHVNYDHFLDFSETKNIIIMVIDGARGDIFEQIVSELSEDEKSIFNGFTFFRNASGSFNSTNPSVSSFLTGILYDCKKTTAEAYPQLFTSSTSLPYQLKKNGFVTEVYPYNKNSVYFTPEIADNIEKNEYRSEKDNLASVEKGLNELSLITRFNFSPHFLKEWLFDSSDMYASTTAIVVQTRSDNIPAKKKTKTDLPEKLKIHVDWNRKIIDRLRTKMTFRQEPVFKYLHFHGAHPPFIHDENYIGQRLPFSLESYKKQYKGALLLTLGALTNSLKKKGVYENTMLIVMGDHGWYIPDADLNSIGQKDLRPVVDSLTPLMMIKPFGQSSSPMKISSAPVSLFDVPATIFSAMGMDTHKIGCSVFSVGENVQRLRHAYIIVPKSKKGSDLGGYLEFEIDGDVQKLGSWKFTHNFLKRGEGEIKIDQAEYDNKLSSTYEFLNNTERFKFKD